MPRATECSREEFMRDAGSHVLRVAKDDGLYRHLQFRGPQGSPYWYDLITWPGGLLIDGDFGSFSFRRTDDMIAFFRAGSGRELIDFRYWAEKCEAMAARGSGLTEFDPPAFRAEVHRQRVSFIRSMRDTLDEEERREAWESITSEVLDHVDDYHDRTGQVAYHLASEWSYSKGSVFSEGWRSFRLDVSEFCSTDRYTHSFLWNCYAIERGVALYDAYKAAEQAPAANDAQAKAAA